jgi:inorganic pyrophosphatase
MIKVFQGFRINVENPAGSTRTGVDKDGKPWSTTMAYDYGEIVNTNGVDGDPVDVFIGPNKSAKFVYVIHTTKKSGQGYDEDKCMLGFDDAMDAKAAFYKNYDEPDHFYGDMSVLTLAQFKAKLHETKENPALIKASKMENAIQLYAQDTNPFHTGDPVHVDGEHGRGVVVGVDGRRVTIRFWNRMYVSRDYIYVHHMSEGNYVSKYYSGRNL